MKKSINFDLDTNKLKEIYPNKSYTQAYDDIKKFLTKNGFEHRQGSGNISKEEMKISQVVKIIQGLNKKHIWLEDCCKTLDYYDVGKAFNAL
ncbi:MAG TPA: VapD family protein, partial [Aliarcobacter sp.]|nr:VapD family protein [Aliarcobacter sp.]